MEILKKLVDGYKLFRKEYFPDNKALYRTLHEEGQSPQAMLITCADSRIATQLIFSTDPGDLFVVRNVANLVPNYEDGEMHMSMTAALEFAVTVLKVRHIIVMGHSSCGGVAALVKGTEMQNDCSISNWVKTFQKAKHAVEQKYPNDSFEEKCRHCELESLSLSLDNLQKYPWIKERCDNGELMLHGWYYEFQTGELSMLDPKAMSLRPLTDLALPI